MESPSQTQSNKLPFTPPVNTQSSKPSSNKQTSPTQSNKQTEPKPSSNKKNTAVNSFMAKDISHMSEKMKGLLKVNNFIAPVICMILSMGLVALVTHVNDEDIADPNKYLKMLLINILISITYIMNVWFKNDTKLRLVVNVICGISMILLAMILTLIDTDFKPSENLSKISVIATIMLMAFTYTGLLTLIKFTEYNDYFKYAGLFVLSFIFMLGSVLSIPTLVNSERPTFNTVKDFLTK